LYSSCVLLLCFNSCLNKAKYNSPDGYDFSKPEKHVLPERLNEISGIAFLNEKLYAVNDEEGKIYRVNFSEKEYAASKFSGKGDYEDLAFLSSKAVVLKSDGSLYVFAIDFLGAREINSTEVFPQFLPKGEYEGIAIHKNKLFVICKECLADKKSKQTTVYEIELNNDVSPKIITSYSLGFSPFKKNGKFYPSSIAKNPVTGDWFIISSANKLLVAVDDAWKMKASYALDPDLFKQPEGIAFSTNGDLYISNEGAGVAASVLKFAFKINSNAP
jgi:uncharacterized protein YjiK